MPEIKWRQTTSWPKSLDTLYGGAELIGKRVAALTDNKFQIQTFAGGEIVPGLQVLDAVQNGTVECGHTALYYYFGKDDTFVFGSALPFGMNSRMQNAWLIHGGGLDLLNEFLKGYNCYVMPGGNTNCPDGRLVPQADREDGRPEGPEVQARRLCRQDHAARRRRAAADCGRRHLSRAREGHHRRRRVGRPATTTRSSASTRSPSSTTIRAGGSRARALVFIVNLDKWNSLPQALQGGAARRPASRPTAGSSSKYDASNAAALKRLAGQGAVLQPFSPEVMDGCYKAAQELYAEINAKNPAFKKLYDSYKAFQDDGYLWHQVADYTMDSYMIRYRNQKT